MNERMLGTVVSAVLAVEREDTEAFNLLMAQAQREDPRGFIMAALATVWKLAHELGQATGATTRAVLEDLALLAAEGEAVLFDLPGEEGPPPNNSSPPSPIRSVAKTEQEYPRRYGPAPSALKLQGEGCAAGAGRPGR